MAMALSILNTSLSAVLIVILSELELGVSFLFDIVVFLESDR